MEQENLQSEMVDQEDKFANLKKVTPLSKLLALALFVALPFIGFWVGYNYAPVEVVEVEKVVEVENKEEVSAKNLEQEVVILTDKDEYERGEVIKIVVNNELDTSILYFKQDRFWGIELFSEGEWINPMYEKGDGFQLAQGDVGDICYIALYELSLPHELVSHTGISSEWNQQICIFGDEGPDVPRTIRYIESGKYRFVFYYGYETLEENPYRLDGSEKVYSNVFTIK